MTRDAASWKTPQKVELTKLMGRVFFEDKMAHNLSTSFIFVNFFIDDDELLLNKRIANVWW